MAAKPGYVMGNTDRERRRLALQASILNPLTDSFLRRVGISAGMRVLELGCGIGEVTLITARLIGPHGSLLSLDIDEASIETARGRLASAGHANVSLEVADILAFDPDRTFDAVIGRHILIHMPDALAVLRRAVAMLHSGGVLAFQEYDLDVILRAYPEMPLLSRVQDLIAQFFRRAVPCANMGMRLPHLMQEAGMPPPEVRFEATVDGGPYSPVYELCAETVRSILPRMEALGITTAAELDIDTLADRLRGEALEMRGFVPAPPMVGAFARKP